MQTRETITRRTETQRAWEFLQRDPLLNFSSASALLYRDAHIISLVESGEAVVGAAVATPTVGNELPLVRLDAIGPVALRRLLAGMREKPRRLLLQRDWLAAALERELGALRVRSRVELFAGHLPREANREINLAASLPHEENREIKIGLADGMVPNAPDERVRVLTGEEIATLQAQSATWNLTVLADHLACGWQAFGIYERGALVAQACVGSPTGELEEISNLYTAPEWRDRGLARAVVGAAMQAVGGRGHTPVYFSRSANTASRRVAERCGLRHVASLQEVVVEYSTH